MKDGALRIGRSVTGAVSALLLILGLPGAAVGAVANSASASGALAPLPASNYAVHSVCASPLPGRASCLALHLVPTTAAARAYTHPLGMIRRRAIKPASAAEGTYGLRPEDLHGAYGLPTEPAAGSPPQTIAIVDAYNDPTAENDLKVYDEEFHLPACTTANGCFAKLNHEGKNSPLPETNDGWALEISLDIETAHAVCQSCHIMLLEASSNSYEALEAAERRATEDGATEVSNSWGGSEPASDSEAFNHPGVVITASSGDDGYLNWDAPSAEERGFADYPASSPHVVAVGGTHLGVEEGVWKEETVWNEANKGAGADGGGCSGVFTAQPWQQAVSDWSNVGCGSHRAVADVAADADPYTGLAVYDSTPYEGSTGWITVGGTSLASPLIASTFALAGGAGGVNYPAQTLYSHLGSGSLHDVLSGSNGGCSKVNRRTGVSNCTLAEDEADCSHTLICNAGVGYDGPTGVGTPDGIGAFRSKLDAPRAFTVNGILPTTKLAAILGLGTITLENALLGRATCKTIGAGSIWNEGNEGVAQTEAFTTYDCSAPSCPGLFMTAEKPLELVEREVENSKKEKEKVKVAQRGASTLPWAANLVETTNSLGESELRLEVKNVNVTIVAPCEGAELSFEGSLEPKLMNGIKNGLFPSHLLYTKETGHLTTSALAKEENSLFLTDEMAIMGGQEQLISGE